jgi:hypothetical protein
MVYANSAKSQPWVIFFMETRVDQCVPIAYCLAIPTSQTIIVTAPTAPRSHQSALAWDYGKAKLLSILLKRNRLILIVEAKSLDIVVEMIKIAHYRLAVLCHGDGITQPGHGGSQAV